MATTFHLFPDLPWEIRSRIWELTVEPRTVDVHISYEWDDVSAEARAKYHHIRLQLLCLRSSTPVPAPLQACREARNHLTSVTKEGYRYYRRAFNQLPDAKGIGGEWIKCETREHRLDLGLEAEPRYVWVDFDVDMISTGETPFEYFESYYLDIKRWKFARDRFSPNMPDGDFDEYDSYAIRKLVNAEEIHVICLGPEEIRGFRLGRGVEDWEATHEMFCFPCDKDRLLLIDPKDGRTVKAADNDAVCEEKRYAYYRGNGAFINPDTMQPFVPFLPPGWFEGQEEWDFFYVDDEFYEDAYPTSR